MSDSTKIEPMDEGGFGVPLGEEQWFRTSLILIGDSRQQTPFSCLRETVGPGQTRRKGPSLSQHDRLPMPPNPPPTLNCQSWPDKPAKVLRHEIGDENHPTF